MKKQSLIIFITICILVLTACSSGATATATTSFIAEQTAGTSATESIIIAPTTQIAFEDVNAEWDASSAMQITLNGDSISTSDASVSVDGSNATITASGIYVVNGTLNDGQLIVDTEDEDPVKLVLNGVSINNTDSSAIYVANAKNVILILGDGSVNQVADGDNYVFASTDEDEPNAAIFSKADLFVYGSGSLTVSANYNDGIASKDGLLIGGGTISVNAVDDGIRGKDYLVVKSGNLKVNAGGDGLKSDNEEDTSLGYISIESGSLNITSGHDGLDAFTSVFLSGGDLTITSGGGAGQLVDETSFAKGIKGSTSVSITDGSFKINSADDAIHSNGAIVVSGGTFDIQTGDDGLHADATLTINGGNLLITQSYEGVESAIITINDGILQITSRDDAINVAGGMDGSGMMNGGIGAMNPEMGTPADGERLAGGGPGGGSRPGGQPDVMPDTQSNEQPAMNPAQPMDAFINNTSYFLYMNGGYVYADGNGDGVDVNGGVVMTGGTLLVNGPTKNGNGALDYDSGFTLSGGTVIAVGSAGMALIPGSTSSTQNAVIINLDAVQSAGTLLRVQNQAGEEIFTFAPSKEYQSLAFTSASLNTGETYTLLLGGSSTGTVTDGLFQGGNYSGGTVYSEFTISSPVTTIGGQDI